MTTPLIGYTRGSSRINTVATPQDKAIAEAKAKGLPAPRRGPSGLEARFAALLKRYGLPEPETEYVYAPPRKFRADFFWNRAGLIVECEGGVFGGKNGHNSGIGIERDCLRARLASLFGYRVFRVTRKALDENEAEIMAQLRAILIPKGEDETEG